MNGMQFVVLLAVLVLAAVAIIALGSPATPVPEPGDDARQPTTHADSASPVGEDQAETGGLPDAVDRASTTSPDTAAGWRYRRTAVADLDADAVPERLVLAADVFVTEEGEPMWGNDHRWAVYVEEDDGGRTLVYSAVVPPGGVSAAVAAAAPSGFRDIVVVEQGPRRARLLLATYEGAGRARVAEATGTTVERWADQVAEERR